MQPQQVGLRCEAAVLVALRTAAAQGRVLVQQQQLQQLRPLVSLRQPPLPVANTTKESKNKVSQIVIFTSHTVS